MTCWRYLQCKRKEGSEGGKKEGWKVGGKGQEQRRPGDTQNDAKIRPQNQLGGGPATTVPRMSTMAPTPLPPTSRIESLWSLVPGSLCHHLPIPFRHIPGYTPHSRCPGGGGRERRYFAFSPSLWRGGPWCIMWRVSVGLGPPILPSILAHPTPYAPRGADVLSPTLWTPENWTCQKQRLKSTSA